MGCSGCLKLNLARKNLDLNYFSWKYSGSVYGIGKRSGRPKLKWKLFFPQNVKTQSHRASIRPVFLHAFRTTKIIDASKSKNTPVANGKSEFSSKLQNECVSSAQIVFLFLWNFHNDYIYHSTASSSTSSLCGATEAHSSAMEPDCRYTASLARWYIDSEPETDTHIHAIGNILYLWFYFRGHYNNEIDKRFRAKIIRKMEFICSAMAMVCVCVCSVRCAVCTCRSPLISLFPYILLYRRIRFWLVKNCTTAPFRTVCCAVFNHFWKSFVWIDSRCIVTFRMALHLRKETQKQKPSASISNQAKRRIFNCVCLTMANSDNRTAIDQ